MNNGKAIIENTMGSYAMTIPSKKNWLVLIFGTLWLGGWYIGFKNAFTTLDQSQKTDYNDIDTFMVFWLIAWTIGGILVVFMLLWGFFGKEKLFMNRQEVVLEKTIFGIGKKRRLNKQNVSNFRFEKVNDNMFGGSRWAIWGFGPGKIKFDYGLKTYSFGLAVDDAEANYLSEELNKRNANH